MTTKLVINAYFQAYYFLYNVRDAFSQYNGNDDNNACNKYSIKNNNDNNKVVISTFSLFSAFSKRIDAIVPVLSVRPSVSLSRSYIWELRSVTKIIY